MFPRSARVTFALLLLGFLALPLQSSNSGGAGDDCESDEDCQDGLVCLSEGKCAEQIVVTAQAPAPNRIVITGGGGGGFSTHMEHYLTFGPLVPYPRLEEEQDTITSILCWSQMVSNAGATAGNWPLSGWFNEPREWDQQGNVTKYHRAIDIAAPNGTPVYAAHSGTVHAINKGIPIGKGPTNNSSYSDAGNYVWIRDANGRLHRYLHLGTVSANLSVGQTVHAYQQIGTSDDTGSSDGPHLHYDLSSDTRLLSDRSNRIDPLSVFGCYNWPI